ncbi:acyl-ACP--UDP-N-acetylglucosamine O-acyltransferase [Nitrospirillum sp. BR 11828]|uniref:acyl-ACP--UDP-N-acetylglucosamine O-acyltransferase n=1 Tax=Nitrospirillum sp. BR 11828 TaxID=3104325 RepID=UPI002ACAB877|nr:acyl-ACP--UDP-N-acetylglucosamine O-acyltransferase [Nitrospirillum sp. BR 11828]MDZ5647812.1 acyl-ACP--UDP-N-acetylglucosamine O-acyltransferase [Nitrospirillum sp. BR 11828]
MSASAAETVIHPTAVVDPAAQIGAGVKIGPFCVVGPHVTLGDGVDLKSHVVVEGRTQVGSGTVIFPFASIGQVPQDLKYKGEPSELIIGRNNRIREHVTMSIGTEGGGMVTRVGDGCLFMASTHVGHDCQVGNNVIMANNATLAGHVEVGDNAILGGLSAVLQWVRIGAHAMIGGMSGVENDVIPYGLVKGDRAFLAGLNLVGLTRHGFAREDIQSLRSAFDGIFGQEGTLMDRMAAVESAHPAPVVGEVLTFIRGRNGRPLCQPR